MRYAVKYCGGCNPRFDRLACARRLERQLGFPLEAAREGERYDRLYVICGCTSRCAEISAYQAGEIVLIDHI